MASGFEKTAVDGRILHGGSGMAVAQLGRLCVVIWRDGVIHARFEQQRAALAEVVRSQPGGVGFLCIIEPTAKPPDDELRRASIEMITSHGAQLKCTAVVIEGEGFKAAITRGVLSGMALLLSRKVHAEAFSSAETAIKWMRDQLPMPPIETVVDFVEALRQQLEPARK